jgi:hypothetical protein
MPLRINHLLLPVALILSSTSPSFAADSPPAIDYASLKTPGSVIAGEAIEINFRATDDVGLDSIGPVASYRSLEYPKLFIYFSNCFLTSGDRKDGNWKCKIPTEKSNPLGKYRLILVLTDTVGQHSIEEPISGWTNIANFEMRELTAAEKAAADAAAEKLAADKAAADKAAADKAAADKAAALLAQQTAVAAKVAKGKKTTIACIKGKVTKKVTSAKPKCPAGYKKK